MGVALTNPNDRRRIGPIKRLVAKVYRKQYGAQVDAMPAKDRASFRKQAMNDVADGIVKQYAVVAKEAGELRRTDPAAARNMVRNAIANMYQQNGMTYHNVGAGPGKAWGPDFWDRVNAAKSSMSAEQKKQHQLDGAAAARIVVKQLKTLNPAGYKDQVFRRLGADGKYKETKRSYAARYFGGKADRYLVKAKKGGAVPVYGKNSSNPGGARKGNFFGGKFKYRDANGNLVDNTKLAAVFAERGGFMPYVNQAGLDKYNAINVDFRKRHAAEIEATPTKTGRWNATRGNFKIKGKGGSQKQVAYSTRFEKQLGQWGKVVDPVKSKAEWDALNNPGIFGGVALTNPGIFGGVALTNPTVEGTVDYVKYALPIAAGAGVGVLAHYYLVPMIDENVYSKIPVVGEYLSEYGYAATGLLAGAALGAGAAMLDGDLRHYAALAAAGVIAAGGALQVAQALGLLNAESDSGEEVEASNNPGIFGGVALTNGGIFGNLAGASEVDHYVTSFRALASQGRVTGARRNQFAKDLKAQGVNSEEIADLIRTANKASDLEKERRASKNASKKHKLADKRDKQLEYFDKYADELTSNAGVSAAGGGAVAAQAQANPGIFSGVALTNPGIFGALGMAGGYGDGMAYEIASITPVDETAHAYSGAGAAMADAMHCGADLDVVEGQAAVAGEGAWNAKFGAPPVRIAPMGGAQGSASHLAGRQGHRWGWLIKMVGFPQFQKMAALPPAQRLNVIQRVRKAAVDTFTREMAAANAGAAEAQENPGIFGDLGASGAFTSEGAGTSYGSTLFAADASF